MIKLFGECDSVLPATSSAEVRWHPTHTRYEDDFSAMENEIVESTPDYAELIELASRRQNQPPQSWWDQDTNPFSRGD